MALLLPLISLLPLGWLWLWERGYLPYWLAAAFTASVIGYLFQTLALKRAIGDRGAERPIAEDANAMSADPSWTSREQAAWSAVEAIAADIKPTDLGDRDKAIAMGLRVVEAVAREIHPQDRDPLWKFTVPEALALIERICADLRPFVADAIPLGDQLTIGQVLRIYQWRSVIDAADKMYDVWRIVRLINPAAAAAQEAREQLTRRLYTGLRDEIGRRLAKGYVREVGKASIDLYGGRLRVSQSTLKGHISSSTLRDREGAQTFAEPLRVLIVGQRSAEPLSIAEALSQGGEGRIQIEKDGEFRIHETTPDGLPPLLLIESEGVDVGKRGVLRDTVERALDSDLVLWVKTTGEMTRARDREALDAIRSALAEHSDRVEPPIVVVQRQGTDPENVGELANGARLVNSRNGDTATLAEALGVRDDDIVSLAFDGDRITAPAREALLAAVARRVPRAQRAQLRRLIADATPRWTVGKLLRQGAKAGWTAARSMLPGRSS